MKERTIDINHQLQRLSDMEYLIEPTKTNAGKRVLPMTPDVYMILLLIRYVTDGIRARKRIANHIRRTQEN